MTKPKHTGGYSIVTRTEEGEGHKFRRTNTLAGHVQFDIEHPNPNWTPGYRAWLARQVIVRGVLDEAPDEVGNEEPGR
jgi:hypothetical protein